MLSRLFCQPRIEASACCIEDDHLHASCDLARRNSRNRHLTERGCPIADGDDRKERVTRAPCLSRAGATIARPGTTLGRSSLWLLLVFVILMGLFFGTIALRGGIDEARRLSIQAGGKFYSLPGLALTLVAAALSAVTAGGLALVAIIRRGERSITMLLPLLAGLAVILWTIGELSEAR